MTDERPSPPPPSRPGGKTESWRVERMVQRVPAHLGETTPESVSPWVMVTGIVLLIVVVCAVLFFLLGGAARFFAAAPTPTATRPNAFTPPITIIPVTLPPPTATPAPTIATVKYKVKQGDNLIEIAAKYKVTVQAIMTANGMKNDTIHVGDDLIIPLPTPIPVPGTKTPSPSSGTPTPLSQESPPSTAVAAETPGVIYHLVQRGDSLSTIASTYSTTVDTIRIANQLTSDFLSVGQSLTIPVGAWTPTPAPTFTPQTTATPTAQFLYAAPNLKLPADRQTFRGKQEAPILEWVSPATLKPNEFYVVHLTVNKKDLPPITVRQGNSIRLDSATYYSGENPNGTVFTWYVLIVSQNSNSARAPTISTQLAASSPPSETRTFVWY
jgi:LysM repeat protein